MSKPTDEERFWAKVQKVSNCWLWMAGQNGQGYGSLNIAGKMVAAHRYSYELHIGPIPEGMQVLHHCDIPACVNPDHLFLGTVADNVADKVRKGRGSCGIGEKSGAAKLTEVQVLEIRQYSVSGVLQSELSKKYGISQGQVSNIIYRKCWNHLPDTPLPNLLPLPKKEHVENNVPLQTVDSLQSQEYTEGKYEIRKAYAYLWPTNPTA